MPLSKIMKAIYDSKYREEHRERAREKYRRWYSKNRISALNRNREWRLSHSYKSRANSQELRVIIVNLLLERDGDLCGICGERLNGDYSIDHKIPLCCEGDHSAENIQLAHKSCNIRKRRKTYGKGVDF